MIISITEFTQWIAAMLAFVVSLLTLYNAAKLRTGILAVATYAFGAGMLFLSLAFLFSAAPSWAGSSIILTVNNFLYIFGFILLGYGSWRIFKMSRIK